MYQVERTNDEVLTIRHTDVCAGWEQRYLLISDVHFDSPHCDRKLLTKHLTQAKDKSAGVLCIGDWFDAMGGRNDKRATKETIRLSNSRDNYFDCLVESSNDYLFDYRSSLVMLADGNHETAILRHNETDLLERLCRNLDTNHMGYSGYVRFMFDRDRSQTRRTLWFHHGSGGGGPVTRGVIQANRRAASVDADIFVSGHIHEAWALENIVVKLSNKGRVYYAPQIHVQLPTYKHEPSSHGYHAEKGRPAKPLGGYWLIFHYDDEQPGRIGYRVERAN